MEHRETGSRPQDDWLAEEMRRIEDTRQTPCCNCCASSRTALGPPLPS